MQSASQLFADHRNMAEYFIADADAVQQLRSASKPQYIMQYSVASLLRALTTLMEAGLVKSAWAVALAGIAIITINMSQFH